MIVGSHTLRKLDIRSQSKASLILHGLKDSNERIKLLKGGKSFAGALEKTLFTKEVEKRKETLSSSMAIPKKFSLPSNLEFLEIKSNNYKWSLLNKLEKSCEDFTPASAKPITQKLPLDLVSPRDITSRKDASQDLTERKIQVFAARKFNHVEDPKMKDLLLNCHVLSLRDQQKRRLERRLQEVNDVKDKLLIEQFQKKLSGQKAPEVSQSLKKHHGPKIVFKWHGDNKLINFEHQPNHKEKQIGRFLSEPAQQTEESTNRKMSLSPRNVIITLPSKSDLLMVEEDEDNQQRKLARINPVKALNPNVKVRNFSLSKLFNKHPNDKAKALNSKLEVRRLGVNRYQIRDIEQEKLRNIVKNCVRSKKTDDQFIDKLCQF